MRAVPRYGLVLATAASAAWAVEPAGPTKADSVATIREVEIAQLLEQIRREFDIPAIAAGLVDSDRRFVMAAVGVRRRGSAVAVTTKDSWHLGSDTKAMTAALTARLVEEGKLQWDSTMAQVFPKAAAGMAPAMREVTVRHLLSHRAGLPANLDLQAFGGDPVRVLRRRAMEEFLGHSPENPPGTRYLYSNLGYIIAGAVIEQVTRTSWEDAIREKLFEPLHMASAGFGGTGTPGKLDQPWGHLADGRPVTGNGPTVDNPPVIGPAGRVHCTMEDWARFVADQLRGARGKPGLLDKQSYTALQTPPFGGEYALGWMVLQRPWGGGTVLHHGGDNTMNHANVWIAPARDFAVLACVNQGGDTAFKASDRAVAALIQLHAAHTAKRGSPQNSE